MEKKLITLQGAALTSQLLPRQQEPGHPVAAVTILNSRIYRCLEGAIVCSLLSKLTFFKTWGPALSWCNLSELSLLCGVLPSYSARGSGLWMFGKLRMFCSTASSCKLLQVYQKPNALFLLYNCSPPTEGSSAAHYATAKVRK